MLKMEIKKKTLPLLIMVLLFAFLVRLDTLSVQKDFWHDEAFQYLYSQKSVKFILDSNDVHPPLFNLFTKLLLSIGFKSIFWLRYIMLSISILFIFHFFKTIKEIFNEKIALFSTAMLSFSYTYLYYSIEFRSYMFVLLFTILQIRYFNKLLDDEPVISYYVALSLILLYSHYMAGLIILVQVIYFIWKFNEYDDFVKTEVLTGFFMTASFSIPLVIYMLKTLPKIQSFWFKDIGFTSLISTFAYILSPPSNIVYGFSMFYIFILVTMILYQLYKDSKYQQFLMYLLIPVILMWIVSQFFPFYHHRYFLFGGMAFFVLVAVGIDKLNKKIHKKYPDIDYFIIAVWLVLFISSFWHFSSNLDTELYDSAIYMFNYTNNATDDFVFLHSSTFSQSPYKIYFPEQKHYLMTNLTREQLFTAGGSVVEDDEIIREVSDLKTITQDIYAISDKRIFHNIIYEEGGLYVTKIN